MTVCAYSNLSYQACKRMRRILLSSVACLALPYFFTLSHKGKDSRKNVTEHKMCVLIFYTTFIWNVSRSKENSARDCRKCTYVFIQVPVILVRF
jgi:hypothetical protein